MALAGDDVQGGSGSRFGQRLADSYRHGGVFFAVDDCGGHGDLLQAITDIEVHRGLRLALESLLVGAGHHHVHHPSSHALLDTVGRAEWIDRAAIIASYREAFSIEGSDPIGAAPPAARQWWHAARTALTETKPPAAWASDEDLAERIAAGDRAEKDRPVLVGAAHGAAVLEVARQL